MTDIICHELRNPLNGIYHNGEIVYDSIVKIRETMSSLREEIARSHASPFAPPLITSQATAEAWTQFLDDLEDELTHDLDSMEALNQCAKHQNRITEDVLQLGKLSMNLVSLKEVPFDPIMEIKHCMRMFEREVLAKKIELKMSVGKEYESFKIGLVNGDPVRFAQVLLNLLSNAVRFTENALRRIIEITFNASKEEPHFSSSFERSWRRGYHPGGKDIFVSGSLRRHQRFNLLDQLGHRHWCWSY